MQHPKKNTVYIPIFFFRFSFSQTTPTNMSTTFLTSISNTKKKKSSSKIDLPKHYKFSTSPKSNGDNKIFANMHEKLAMFASESVSTQLIRKRKELGEAESTLSDIRQVSTKNLNLWIKETLRFVERKERFNRR